MAFTPSRRVVTRSPHRRVGHVSCPWFQEDQIDWESLFEKGFIHIALLCPGLVELQFQPFKLQLSSGLCYTPDFLLTFCDSSKLVVEVKPREFVSAHAEKLDAAKAILQARGIGFKVCTEREIDSDDRRSRASKILRHARSTAANLHADIVVKQIPQWKFPISLSELVDRTGLAPHELCGVIGRRALFLRPDLNLDEIHSKESIKGVCHVLSSYSAWIAA
ncbi:MULTISPECIES: TnsA endonuclease N-terminal domain-containing protein [Achromobacter]|uniref:TnsA endonuclease N-terminal domain-containing protein n=1 Tax=Achromobacter TaxID=222 RepID=UPI0014677012|nr:MULTISPECIES: TnsA endonuclease N-terminal domain-containing protein [Achromobacter]CAB3849361.1 hypothetical protein LMG26689_01894 [Achromobacter animicus]